LERLSFFLRDYRVGRELRTFMMRREGEMVGSKEMISYMPVQQHLARNPAYNVFSGAFTCCMLNHTLGAQGGIACDKTRILPIVEKMYDRMLRKLRLEDDMLTWRRMKALRWAQLHDGSTQTSDAQLAVQTSFASVKDFLSAYEIPSVDAELGKSMRALHYAAYANAADASTLLINAGAPVDARDSDGFTPLMLATSCGATEAMKSLLAHGADATLRNNGKRRLFAMACIFNTCSALQVLIDEGLLASMAHFVTDDSEKIFGGPGLNALHLCAALWRTDAARCLLEASMDPFARVAEGYPDAGRDALTIAKDRGAPQDLIDLLSSAIVSHI